MDARPIGELAAEVLERAEQSGQLIEPPDPVEEAAREHERSIRMHMQSLVESRNIPFKDAKLIAMGELQETSALAMARRFYEKATYGGVLVLAGTEGVGKTTAASWLVAQEPRLAFPYGESERWPALTHPRFVEATDLMAGGLYDKELAMLRRPSILAIDDVGVEFKDAKGAFTSLFERVINLRYAGCGWTLCTTNLSWDTFQKSYGLRVAARLREANRGYYHINEPSLRTPSGTGGRVAQQHHSQRASA